MTSTRNLHQSPANNKTTPKMTNTKSHHEGQAVAPPSESQPSQQDLIRLLAQHFNNQFYQNMTNNQPQQQQQQHPAPSDPSTQLIHNLSSNNAINFNQSPLAQYQQQQQLQFRTNQEAINFVSPGARLVPPPIGGAQIPRSHHPQPATPGAPHHGSQFQQQQPAPIPNPNPLTCNPFFGEGGFNLFNALNCFNVTNDQFLLSLQQQYLLQAASSAARQTATSRQVGHNATTTNNDHPQPMSRLLDSSPQLQQQQQQLQQHHQAMQQLMQNQRQLMQGSATDTGRAPEDPASENRSGRELLKFSINTILGRGSPANPQQLHETKPKAPATAALNQYLTGQDRLLSARKPAKNLRTPPTARDNDCASTVNTPDDDCDRDSDAESDTSLTMTPQPNGGLDQAGKPINSNNNNQMFDGLSINPQDAAHPSASSSMLQQRPSSGDPMSVEINQGGRQQATTLSFLSGSAGAFPWTVAARGKPRRGMMRRAVFSDSQRVGLEKRFQLQKYISKPDRKKLAEKLGLRDSQVKIWFQNRRMKWRNSKERELLSAGGSREQTLPTRNNPNPDLSDVGETIKRLVSGPNSIGAA